MRLEDAQIFVLYEVESLEGVDLPGLCRSSIAVGADMICCKFSGPDQNLELLSLVRDVCNEEDALFLVWNDPSIAEKLSASGLHFGTGGGCIGEARAFVGVKGLVGFATDTLEEAMLAAETGADYIVHNGGMLSSSVFARLRGCGVSSLFAGGLNSIEEAAELIQNGIFRICVKIDSQEKANVEVIAQYSRLLGRVV